MSTPPNPFRVAVRDLPATRRIEVSATFVDEAVKGMPLRDALEGDAAVGADGGVAELELYEDGENVFAQGSITGTVTVACSRCVGPAAIKFDERVRVTFLPAHQMPADDAEAAGGEGGESGEGVELAENDLDVFPFDGETVDLEPLVREQFVLAVPFAPLCKEDCRGLCPQCGVDRNVTSCTCERPVDPRFAALQGLKLPS